MGRTNIRGQASSSELWLLSVLCWLLLLLCFACLASVIRSKYSLTLIPLLSSLSLSLSLTTRKRESEMALLKTAALVLATTTTLALAQDPPKPDFPNPWAVPYQSEPGQTGTNQCGSGSDQNSNCQTMSVLPLSCSLLVGS